MIGFPRGRWLAGLGVAFVALGGLAGCKSSDPHRVQGYVEGEFVYVASPLAGTLESLRVERGDQVKAGAPLFALDETPEKAARDEAYRKRAVARANWEDVKKGKRPSEIASLEAQLKQSKVSLQRSESDLAREKRAFRSNATSAQEYDRMLAIRDQDRQRVAQLEADLQTARLGARSDQVEAAEASVRVSEAALARADWDLAQKRQSAPRSGVVFDTLYRPGEWVAAGRPVVALLPPPNIKVRAYVPQTRIGSVKLGQSVRVIVDGVSGLHAGKVSFISPQAEYTPPVIYSQESRAKLVFKIEIRFDPETAANLHPGQPVDVQLEP